MRIRSYIRHTMKQPVSVKNQHYFEKLIIRNIKFLFRSRIATWEGNLIQNLILNYKMNNVFSNIYTYTWRDLSLKKSPMTLIDFIITIDLTHHIMKLMSYYFEKY